MTMIFANPQTTKITAIDYKQQVISYPTLSEGSSRFRGARWGGGRRRGTGAVRGFRWGQAAPWEGATDSTRAASSKSFSVTAPPAEWVFTVRFTVL